jgi:predicted O-methyltransferase YrrM
VTVNVVGLTRSYPKLTLLLRRLRAWLTGRPYYFNRQKMRAQVFDEINSAIRFDNYVETGTYLGLTTYFLGTTAQSGHANVYTCEINEDFLDITRRVAGRLRNMNFALGNSVDFLRDHTSALSKAANFVYLDAHWYDYLPLRDELSILKDWTDTIILIDDFKVPSNPDFGWDKYDRGREISLEYINGSFGSHPVYFPNYPISAEGGPALGYCLIPTSPRMEQVLEKNGHLEKFQGH